MMKPISLNACWQLFLDDHVVGRSTGFSRVLHSPRPRGVVIPADRPWETAGVETLYGSGIGRRADGTFFAFYRAMWWDPQSAELLPAGSRKDRAHHAQFSIAYATSADGIHWDKPVLGLVPAPAECAFDGPWPRPVGKTMQNNIGVPLSDLVDLGQYGNVSDPERRFLLRVIPDVTEANSQPAISTSEAAWPVYFAAHAPDVLNDPQWRTKLTAVDGGLNPRRFYVNFWDPLHAEWVAIEQGCGPGHWIPSREIARFASRDLRHWTVEAVLYPDCEDAHTMECFDEPMTMHPFCAEGITFGLLSWFHSDRTHPEGGPRSDLPTDRVAPWAWYRKGTNDVRVTVSRDGGRSWDRTVSRQAWIPHNPHPHAEDSLPYRPTPPVRVGAEDWFYVTCMDGDHLVVRNSLEQDSYYHDRVVRMNIALYTQLHNRYVSMRAPTAAPQVLITRPVQATGRDIQLNVDASHGTVRVAIAPVDDQRVTMGTGSVVPALAPHLARPLPGFSFEDCEPIHANRIEHTVAFRNGTTMKALAGRPVFILFEMSDADLYGFRCV